MADEKEGGVAAPKADAGSEGGVLDAAVQKVREQREERVAHTVIEEENLPKARRRVVVEIPRDDFDPRVASLFKDLQANASIEGFRKGKVPLKLLQRRYLKEANNDVIEKITPMIVREYEQTRQVTLYGVPAITDYAAEEGKPVRVTLEVEVKPEIEPKDYTGLGVEVPEVKLTDEMIDRRIEELRQQSSTFEEATDKELAQGDAAVLDIKGVDAKGHTVLQESDKLYENPHGELPHAVAHALFGKKAGQSCEVKDGDTRYSVTLKTVKEVKLPDIDDEFAKDLGYDSVAKMREGVRQALQKVIDNVNHDEAFEALTGKLVEAHEFDVPNALKEHVEREMARSDYMYLSQTGVTPPRMRGLSTRSQYQDELDKAAEMRVKGFLLIDAIGKKENIQADDSDVNAALEERAQQEGRKPVAIRAALEKRREWTQFTEQVRFNKIRSFLLEKTRIDYVAPTEEKAEGEGSEPDGETKPKARKSKKASEASE
ncbi:MAG: trigger factor [Candidatus Sumerlaeaceae bacterium]